MGERRAVRAVARLIGEWNPSHALAGTILRVVAQCTRERETANRDIDGCGGSKLAGISFRIGNSNRQLEVAGLEGLA